MQKQQASGKAVKLFLHTFSYFSENPYYLF